MLVGITMPLRSVYHSEVPFGPLDCLASTVCVIGLWIAARSDNELWAYMNLDKDKKPKVLDSGWWGVCRHPNHLGE